MLIKKLGVLVMVGGFLGLFVCGCGGGATTPAGTPEKPIVMKLSHAYSTQHMRQKQAEKFKQLVEEKTGGRVQVEIYPGAQLYNEKEGLEALAMGNIQLAIPPVGELIAYNKKFEILDFPFLVSSEDEMTLFEQSDVGQELLNEIGPFKGLCWLQQGVSFITSNRPVKKPADFKGLKIRVPAGKVQEATAAALGGSAVTIGGADLYTAAQQGMIDGASVTLVSAYSQKMYEVHKYGILLPMQVYQSIFLTNKDFWANLPGDIRNIIETEVIPELTKWNLEEIKKTEADCMQKLKAGGMQIYEPSEKEIEEWTRACEPVWDQFKAEVGDLLDRVRALRGSKA